MPYLVHRNPADIIPSAMALGILDERIRMFLADGAKSLAEIADFIAIQAKSLHEHMPETVSEPLCRAFIAIDVCSQEQNAYGRNAEYLFRAYGTDISRPHEIISYLLAAISGAEQELCAQDPKILDVIEKYKADSAQAPA